VCRLFSRSGGNFETNFTLPRHRQPRYRRPGAVAGLLYNTGETAPEGHLPLFKHSSPVAMTGTRAPAKTGGMKPREPWMAIPALEPFAVASYRVTFIAQFMITSFC
jgi:hypothetical protein